MSNEPDPALLFACERHGSQMYGERGYVSGHLLDVVTLLGRHFPDEVRARFGDDVARLVWAVTSEPGPNRRERNAATYPKIRSGGMRAVALKVCDRISNVQECWGTRSPKLFMYHREYRDFRAALRREEDGLVLLALWTKLDVLMGWYEPTTPRSTT